MGERSERIPTSIDLFAGCGGLTRGLEWAGFECVAFNELNPDAADSFAANFPDAIRLDGDIRSALTSDVISGKLLPVLEEKGGLDLLCGGPPCQGYSGIGHRRTHAVSKRDVPTNHLYSEMIRAIELLQPKVFLFENVEGILTSAWYDFAAEKNLVKSWKNGKSSTKKELIAFAKNFQIQIKSTKKHDILIELASSLNLIFKERKKLIQSWKEGKNFTKKELVTVAECLQIKMIAKKKNDMLVELSESVDKAWKQYKKQVNAWKKYTAFTVEELITFAKSLGINIKSRKKPEMLVELSKSLNQIVKTHKEIHNGEIFRDVFKSFSSIKGYTCQPTLLHAYGFGVPQNRPRVMIMGIKDSVLKKTKLEPTEFDPLIKEISYATQLRNNGGFFPTWDEENVQAPDLIDVISDLDFDGWTLEKPHYRKKPKSEFQKFLREGIEVDSRGRQILMDHEFSNHKPHVIERFQFMLDNKITKKEDLPEHMQTEKFNQKPLPARWPTKPSMTVTSLPDDYVHYRKPRTFSVREWARLQTFPDKHIFCGKRTTGGSRRAGSPENWDREVPKYTQIGNAVPPLLGKAIGEKIRSNIGIGVINR